jgi:hypothetical protein
MNFFDWYESKKSHDECIELLNHNFDYVIYNGNKTKYYVNGILETSQYIQFNNEDTVEYELTSIDKTMFIYYIGSSVVTKEIYDFAESQGFSNISKRQDDKLIYGEKLKLNPKVTGYLDMAKYSYYIKMEISRHKEYLIGEINLSEFLNAMNFEFYMVDKYYKFDHISDFQPKKFKIVDVIACIDELKEFVKSSMDEADRKIAVNFSGKELLKHAYKNEYVSALKFVEIILGTEMKLNLYNDLVKIVKKYSVEKN